VIGTHSQDTGLYMQRTPVEAIGTIVLCLMKCTVLLLQLPPGSVDVDLLHDATRREARGG
jgi:hypothetical protein